MPPGFRPLLSFDFDGNPEIPEPGAYRFHVLFSGEVVGSEPGFFE